MTLSKLRWYAARLAAMSPPEVAHRVREALAKRGWRANKAGWDNYAAIGDGPLAGLPFLREALARGAPQAKAGLAELAAGRLTGLGQSIPAGPDIGWFTDPVRRQMWPGVEAYCFDVDVRTTGRERGDVKFVWEINRMQFLHPLAAAIAADPAPALVAQALGVLKSWAEANPPYRGVNWFSGIELAMRMVTITLITAAIPPQDLGAEDRVFLRRMIGAHGFWLARYPSKYSSANNHLVAEGLGLLLAGMLAPDLPQAGHYEAEGRDILNAEAGRQILADGVGAEQSPTYQAFTMEMLAFGALVAEGLGRPLAPLVNERLHAGATFLRTLMDDAGNVPHIGDDDEGRVIGAPPDREPRYVASVVASVAGLLQAPALSPPMRDRHIRDAVFCAPPGSPGGHTGLTRFASGGYSVGRETIAGRNAVLTFDHGPLGYLSLAAHGHADALAVWLSIDDRPVIVDAGTFLYHSGGPLRAVLRASPAHNTLTLEDASQSVPSSAFSWSSRADATLADSIDGKWWSVTGSHAGYARRFGVTHKRSVARTPTGFSITDHLEGAARAREGAIGLLIAPDIEVSREGDRYVLIAAGDRIAEIITPPSLSARLVREDRQGGMGLYSPRFGDLVAARQIICSGSFSAEPVMTRIDILQRR